MLFGCRRAVIYAFAVYLQVCLYRFVTICCEGFVSPFLKYEQGLIFYRLTKISFCAIIIIEKFVLLQI